jgi:hypothetical protein
MCNGGDTGKLVAQNGVDTGKLVAQNGGETGNLFAPNGGDTVKSVAQKLVLCVPVFICEIIFFLRGSPPIVSGVR